MTFTFVGAIPIFIHTCLKGICILVVIPVGLGMSWIYCVYILFYSLESCTICTFSFHPILYSVLPVYRLWICSFSLLIFLQVSSAAVKTCCFQHPDKKWPLMSSLSHTDFIRCLCQGHQSLSSSTNSNLLSELLNCLRRHVKSVGGVTTPLAISHL